MTIFGTYFETIPLVLMAIFAVCFVYLMLYYGLFHLRVSRYSGTKNKPSKKDNVKLSVSIVLTAKNEEKLLTENLTYLLEQNYPNYEVVVVDNNSFDNTQYVLQLFKNNYPEKLKTLRLTQDVNNFKGKKFPLSVGIQSAKNDIILLTTIDCVPKSFDWLEKMVLPFGKSKTKIVLGYCGLNNKKGLLNAFMQYENLSQSALMFGFALLHKPYCGCGCNMAYRRDFFFKNKGFIQHYHIPFGDDDLFVNKNGNANNTDVCLCEEAFVITEPCKSFSKWIEQRRKLRSTIKHYKFRDRLKLSMLSLMIIMFYIAGLLLYLTQPLPVLGFALLGVLVLKLAWQIVCNFQLCRKFGIKGFVAALSPLFEIYFLFANTFLYLFTLRNKKSNGSNS